ncbi:MAG: glycosyltransferase family 2 protein [Candidatus Heimdallarchaeota archaeon]
MHTNQDAASQKNLFNSFMKIVIGLTIVSWLFGVQVWIMEIYNGNLNPALHFMLILFSSSLLWLFLITFQKGSILELETKSKLIMVSFVAAGAYFSALSSDNETIQGFLEFLGQYQDIFYTFILLTLIGGNVAIALNLTRKKTFRHSLAFFQPQFRPLNDRLLDEGRSTPRISVVFPALNEETTIQQTLRRVPLSALEKRGFEVEMIVVDNGSDDRTAELAAGCGAIVVSESYRGYGNAYKAGFAAAKGDIIVMADADGTYPVETAVQLIQPIVDERADVVLGSRFTGRMEKGAMSRTHNIGNRILTWQLNFLFRFPFKRPISDAHTGFRAFRKDALDKMELYTDGMEFASEMVIETFRKSLRTIEMPITYAPRCMRSRPKLRTFRDGARHFLFMLNSRLTGKRATRFFGRTSYFHDGIVTYQRQPQAMSQLIGFSKLSKDLSSNYFPKKQVALLMPTLNEEKNLPFIVARLPKWFSEIVVVDGHSKDQTVATVRALLPKAKIVFQHGIGIGKGDAIITGLKHVKSELVVLLDADGSMDPAEIARFLKPLEDGYDLVKGSRMLNGGGTVDMTFFRKFGNAFFVGSVNLLYQTSYTDLCYGFNAFRKKAVENLSLGTSGFNFEAELITKAANAGLKIKEVPSFEYRRIHGSSNLNSFFDGLKIFSTIARERLRGFKKH